MQAFLNPAVRRTDDFRGLFTDAEYRDVHNYFAAHPELPPTPLRSLDGFASAVGVARVDVKDETQRFGLNAFKIAGAGYAVHRLGDDAARRGLVCATAGNHGRAVARVAKQKGVGCTIFIPAAGTLDPIEMRTRAARITAMRDDGAAVREVNGSYADAVRRAMTHGRDTGATVVSDTSWDGYVEIPRWIMAGYTQIFEEAHAQWQAPPDVAFIQGGVGGLVCAAASWFARRYGSRRPFLIACEPDNAACLLESARCGRVTPVGGTLDTIMAGLRCAEPSPLAWPPIAAGIDAFVTVPDDRVRAAMRALAASNDSERIDAGPSGACGAAALMALGDAPELAMVRDACGLDRSTRCFLIVTEGA